VSASVKQDPYLVFISECVGGVALSSAFDFDNFPVAVIPTRRAHMMRPLEFPTIWALSVSRCSQSIVGPAHVPLRLCHFSFWNCHKRTFFL